VTNKQAANSAGSDHADALYFTQRWISLQPVFGCLFRWGNYRV